jgi:DNA-binding GntR family transcriptional regulator
MKRKITEQVAAQLDVNFHDNIFRAAHHERLYGSWSSIRMQVHWFLLLRTVASQDWREGMITGHSRILELIRSGDEAGAVAATGQHIRDAYNRICGALIDQQEDRAAIPDARQRAESYLLS